MLSRPSHLIFHRALLIAPLSWPPSSLTRNPKLNAPSPLPTPKQTAGVSDNEEGLSPLAPGNLSGNWTSSAQLAGFDKQTPARTAGTESLSPQDVWNEDEDDSYFPNGGAVRELVWDYLPGETSITLGVRLYLAHLDPFVSHEENCALLLRQASTLRYPQYPFSRRGIASFKTRSVGLSTLFETG